jgi:hypothetical protein
MFRYSKSSSRTSEHSASAGQNYRAFISFLVVQSLSIKCSSLPIETVLKGALIPCFHQVLTLLCFIVQLKICEFNSSIFQSLEVVLNDHRLLRDQNSFRTAARSPCAMSQISDFATAFLTLWLPTSKHAQKATFHQNSKLNFLPSNTKQMPAKTENLKTFCTALPKVELHAHINGSISFATIKKLTERKVGYTWILSHPLRETIDTFLTESRKTAPCRIRDT